MVRVRQNPSMFWQTSRFRVDLSRPRVMGIVNLTPDSFSDGGRYTKPHSALAHCEQLLAQGRHPDLGASPPACTPPVPVKRGAPAALLRRRGAGRPVWLY